MGKAIAAVFALAVVTGIAAFVVSGLVGTRYPFGPDERPMCSGTPDGILPGCRYGPLADGWLDPLLWPAILAFCAVLLVGVMLMEHRRRSV